jgi:hypothetical protein
MPVSGTFATRVLNIGTTLDMGGLPQRGGDAIEKSGSRE